MIKPGIYKHYRTENRYKVHFVAKNTETLEEFVVYEALYDNPDGKYWVRPSKMFSEMVKKNGQKVRRFKHIHTNGL